MIEEYLKTCGAALDEYLMAVTLKLYKGDESYRDVREELEALEQEHPWLGDVYDPAQAHGLTKEEHLVLLAFLQLRIEVASRDRRAAYLRGCYDAIDFLKRAGVL